MGPEDPSRTPPPPAPAPRPTRAAPRRGFLRRVFRENAGVKLISMVLAIALLVVVRQDTGKEVDIEVPVVLSDKADNDVFVGELPKTLRVRVRDRWSRLARALERKASPYLVDLRAEKRKDGWRMVAQLGGENAEAAELTIGRMTIPADRGALRCDQPGRDAAGGRDSHCRALGGRAGTDAALRRRHSVRHRIETLDSKERGVRQ